MEKGNRTPRKTSLLYAFFRPWVAASSRMFFRQIIIEGRENIPPANARYIMVANHQNGMMDPVMLCTWFPRQLHFLTRADVFQKPAANRLFRAFNMLPVFRERDRVDDLSGKNAEIFRECAHRLAEGHVIALFPEGTHGNKKHLRPLKKGVARLAFAAMNDHPQLADLMILPAAVDYSDYFDYRSNLTIRIGRPISVAEYFAKHSEGGPQGTNDLMSAVRRELEACLVHYDPAELYPIGRACFQVIHTETGLADERAFAVHFNRVVSAMDQAQRSELIATVAEYRSRCRAHRLSEMSFGPRLRAGQWATLVSGAPLAVASAILHLPVFYFIERTVRKTVRDEHFISSARLVLTTFGFPLWWLLVSAVAAIAASALWILPVGALGLWAASELTLHLGDLWRQRKATHRLHQLPADEKSLLLNHRATIVKRLSSDRQQP